jgi:hypothetical protein
MKGALATTLAGCPSETRASGRESEMDHFPVCGPMRFFVPLLCASLLALPAVAQNAPPAARSPAPPAAGSATVAPGAKGAEKPAAAGKPQPRPEWRDTTGYRFPAVAKTVGDMQNLAHAMRLRDYCANARVKDDFVRERLARFSAITGREETCRTLLDY